MKKEVSGLIINNNVDEFRRYQLERSKIIRQKSLEKRIEQLESDLSEMKKVIQTIQGRTN